MQMVSYFSTLWYLLQTDYKLFKRTIVDKLIDLFIWVITQVWITVYLLPAFGIEKSYGIFIIAGIIATSGLFEMFASIVNLVTDFEGNGITSFYLTLPMPSWFVFLRLILFYTFNTVIQSFLVIPICKLTYWDFPLTSIHVAQFALMFILSNLFYATFTLWIASMISNIEKIGSVYMRFVYPVWVLGCFQYSLKVLYDHNPVFGILSLANPMVYVLEATRAVILGQEGYINFWLCVVVLTLFIVLTGWHGIARLQKRLDYPT